MGTKLYDISNWCKKGTEVEDYPYIGEIDISVSMGDVILVGGNFYTIGVLNFQNGSAGVRSANRLHFEPSSFSHERNIACPYCGYANLNSWERGDEDDNYECSRCGGIMTYERVVTVEYNSSPKKPPQIVKAKWL